MFDLPLNATAYISLNQKLCAHLLLLCASISHSQPGIFLNCNSETQDIYIQIKL
jgi:hypothetical protein